MPLILLVDDDIDILKVLKANLELANFEVQTATTCAETMEFIKSRIPDLIVLDLMLPDCDGVELCRRLREENYNMPIIMLTARDSVSDRVLGLESGADDYVIKPFEAVELIARIKASLRRVSAAELEYLKVGDIELIPSSRTVRVKGREVQLTPREFDILLLFVKNKDRVLSRDFIRKALWKDAKRLYSWSRVIDVHIQHLRSKIEENPSFPVYLQTVPGIGYKLVEKN